MRHALSLCNQPDTSPLPLDLKAKRVQVKDVYGDGRHVSIEVVSDMFEGQNQMKRQRMVYKVGACTGIPSIP